MTQDVDPDAVLDAAREYNSVRTSAASAVSRLAGVLSSSAGMAGTDTDAHAWAIKYDPLAWGLMDAATAVVQGAGQCYDLLYATGVNHLNADGQSAINNEHVLELPPMGAPSFSKPTIPSAEGGHSDVPEWWHTIAAYVQGELWPNGHQDKLRAAADAWTAAARELRTAAQLGKRWAELTWCARTSDEPEVARVPESHQELHHGARSDQRRRRRM